MDGRRMEFSAIGTKWTVVLNEAIDTSRFAALSREVREVIESFDKSFSRFREDSWVVELSRRVGSFPLPAHGYELLSLYEALYRATGGLVSPLIGQTMVQAGYDADYTLQAGELTQPPRWEDAVRYDHIEITLRQPVLLDFGAAGKGRLVDLVATVLEADGIRSYVVDAGGDIRHRDAEGRTVTIGLEDPADLTEVIGSVDIVNRSICASSGSRRKWDGYHHILNPATLESPSDILATWAVADDSMTADGLATALFFTPAARLRQDFDFDYVVLRSDRGAEYSNRLQISI